MTQRTSSTTARAGNVAVSGAIVAFGMSFVADSLTTEQAVNASVIAMAVLGIASKVVRNAVQGTRWEDVLS